MDAEHVANLLCLGNRLISYNKKCKIFVHLTLQIEFHCQTCLVDMNLPEHMLFSLIPTTTGIATISINNIQMNVPLIAEKCNTFYVADTKYVMEY